MTRKPWHDAPACRDPGGCPLRTATPFEIHQRGFNVDWNDATPKRPDHLICAACGYDWIEKDPERVAQAWWSAGAEEGRLVMEREMELRDPYCGG